MNDTSTVKHEFTDLRINPDVPSAKARAKLLRIVANEVLKPKLPLAAATFFPQRRVHSTGMAEEALLLRQQLLLSSCTAMSALAPPNVLLNSRE